MEIILKRKFFKPDYTIGELYINGLKVCDTLEPPHGGLNQRSTLKEVLSVKKKGKCCIPYGTYTVVVTKSPRFKEWLPLLLGVRGFSGIRIHAGNFPKDTEGCILPGWNTRKGMVTESRKALKKIIDSLTQIYARRDVVKIKITR